MKENNGKTQDFVKKNAEAVNCKAQGKCGGCLGFGTSYEKHLKLKNKRFSQLFDKYIKTEPIIGMEYPYHYRHKVHAVFGEDRKHNIISGTYEANSHRIVPIDACLLEDESADAIIVSIRELLKSFKIRPYNEDTGYGLLRHVMIRKGYHSDELMVVLVVSGPVFPSKKNFVKALLKAHPEITTVVMNINSKKTSMVLGNKEEVLYGKGFIMDSLCDKQFKISPSSFYQVNPCQTEILYSKAIEFAEFTGKESVLDAYCGTGTIGIIASDQVKEVIGVELNKAAVADAKINAKQNQIKNIRFVEQDAGKFMEMFAAKNQSVDVVLMDPPRSGSDKAFLSSLVKMGPKKVVYVSCNPETLARDLKFLTENGYGVKKMEGVDMFPWTEHVETVALMSKVNTVKG